MRSRRVLGFALFGLMAWFAWQSFSRAGQETVVVHMTGATQDHFVTLWVIDDPPYLWIRAENRTRRWIRLLQESRRIEVRRAGRSLRYSARWFDTPDAQSYVDREFRAKYGLADWLSAALGSRDTLPIRLEPE